MVQHLKGFWLRHADGRDARCVSSIAILRRAGLDEVSDGASLLCDIGESGKGPLVLSILSVEQLQRRRPASNAVRRPPATALNRTRRWTAR